MSDVDTTGWTQEQIDALKDAEAELSEADEALELFGGEARSKASSPAAVIAERKRAAESKREELTALRIYSEACEKFGEARVVKIKYPDGHVILRPMSAIEVEQSIAHDTTGLSTLDKVKLGRDEIAMCLLHPSKAKFCADMQLFPGRWHDLVEARESQSRGVREDLSKKG